MSDSKEKSDCVGCSFVLNDFYKFNEIELFAEFSKKDKLTIEELLDNIAALYPHVAYKLKLLLGFREFEIEINNLLINDRNNRLGFDKSTFSNLIKLYFAHINKYGNLTSVATDIWSLPKPH